MPVDFGPLYKETQLGRWPVEPWSTVTTLWFFLVFIYWFLKVSKNPKDHQLLMILLPLLGVGAIGGFIYHSTRSHVGWLLMDWLPIPLCCLLSAAVFWRHILNSWKKALSFLFVPFLILFLVREQMGQERVLLTSFAYGLIFTSVLLPVFIFAHFKHYAHARLLFLALASISLALLLRIYDRHQMMAIFPMGTHFLWHTMGALTCHLMLSYIFKMKVSLQ